MVVSFPFWNIFMRSWNRSVSWKFFHVCSICPVVEHIVPVSWDHFWRMELRPLWFYLESFCLVLQNENVIAWKIIKSSMNATFLSIETNIKKLGVARHSPGPRPWITANWWIYLMVELVWEGYFTSKTTTLRQFKPIHDCL